MSLYPSAPVAPRPAWLRPPGRARLLGGGFVVLLLASQLVGEPARAERPVPTTRLSAEQAEDAGQEVNLAERPVGASTLLVATLPDPGGDTVAPAFEAARLLDSSRSGATILVADVVADFAANVTVQSDDGSQLLVSVPGVIDASLRPTGRGLPSSTASADCCASIRRPARPRSWHAVRSWVRSSSSPRERCFSSRSARSRRHGSPGWSASIR